MKRPNEEALSAVEEILRVLRDVPTLDAALDAMGPGPARSLESRLAELLDDLAPDLCSDCVMRSEEEAKRRDEADERAAEKRERDEKQLRDLVAEARMLREMRGGDGTDR